jgi:hypothetical protein
MKGNAELDGFYIDCTDTHLAEILSAVIEGAIETRETEGVDGETDGWYILTSPMTSEAVAEVQRRHKKRIKNDT